jgi:hypothetical protein
MEDEIKRKLRRESKSKLFIAKKTKFLSHKKVDIPKKKTFPYSTLPYQPDTPLYIFSFPTFSQ